MRKIGSISALLLAAAVALLGPVFYWLMAAPHSRQRLGPARVQEPVADYSAEI